MKKVLILIAGVAIMSSCKKCAECTTTTESNVLGTTSSTSNTEEYCGKKKDVEDWKSSQKAGDSSVSLFGITTSVSTSCTDI